MKRESRRVDENERLRDLRALGLLDTPPEERFDRITRIAQQLFNVPIALVSLVDEDRQWFMSRAGLEVKETPREISFCTHAIQSNEVLHVRDASLDNRFRDSPLVTGEPNIRFYAGCAIDSPGGNKIGTLCLIDHEPRQLTPVQLGSLRDLARMVEEEIAVTQLATSDSLTKLCNRRGFFQIGHQVLKIAKRTNKPVSLAFVDLDGMKRINDRHGHDAGDHALIDTARLLSEVFRESDVIARLSGDEFCALCSGASALEAGAAISRLHEAVASRNERQKEEPRLSLSVGLAGWEASSDETLSDLMKRADRGMYVDKRSKEGEASPR